MAASAATPSPSAEPYVGPRPFERHERNLFHGRTTDARILCDRILSGRLTILYGQSGLGKSSLLRTRVIPMVEEHGARAVYFDDWSQSDPLHTLKETLAALAQSIGVPDADAGSPTLTNLVRLISGANGLSVVLVLDQFEEFLVRNADRLDPLRGEIATLVRSTAADVAVVLSLREEYLAALEPFRQKIGNLFESAYRLEELPEKDLRDAILEPPKLFGGECEAALADKLIADLRTGVATAATDARSSFVGLPMLQLVCRELWRDASAGGKVLSLTSYERLGGAQRIVDNYVGGLMPKRARARSLTAGLLKHLAPRSGLKNPCSVEDLTDAHSKAPAVEAELKRLSRAGILRSREYNAAVVYELQHDAFIRVLREWRDGVLEHDRRRKRMFRVLFAGVLLAALFYTWASVRVHQTRMLAQEEQKRARLEAQGAERVADEQKRTQALKNQLEGGLLDDLKKDDPLAPSRFDVVTTYLLWDDKEKRDPQSLAKLQNMLQQHEKFLPASYGMRTAEPDAGTFKSPLTIEVPKSRTGALDTTQFMALWRDYGGYIAGATGYPVPMKIHFETGDGLGAEELGVSAADSPRVKVRAPTYDRELVVRFNASAVKDGRAKDFLDRYVPAEQFQPGYPWVLIPRWSLPVWKAAKERDHLGYDEVAIDASGLAAYHVLTDLARPDDSKQAIRKAFLTPRAVDALLRNAAHRYPAAVEEARAERGPCLVDDLRALVQKDPYALLDLPLALDHLANERCEQPTGSQVAPERGQRSAATQPAGQPRAAPRDTRGSGVALLKPRPANLAPIDADDSFSGLEEHLPMADSRFQVYGGVAVGEVEERELQDIRTVLYRKYGVIPEFSFQPGEGDSRPKEVLRVDVKSFPEAKAAIRSRAEEKRDLWITPDSTQVLENHLPPNTRNWIRQQYSLTSVKRVLQTVAVRSKGTDGGIRYPGWLLTSLVFWGVAEEAAPDGGGLDGEKMAQDLLQTQLARVHPPAAGTPSDAAYTLTKYGVIFLAADDVSAAINSFSSAIQLNPTLARQTFLEWWPLQLPEIWIEAIHSRFDDLNKVNLDPGERIDLEDLHAALPSLYTTDGRELVLFRLAAGVETNRSGALKDLLDSGERMNQWPLPQARWLAVEFLKQWDPSDSKTGSQRHFDAAVALLKRVVEKARNQQDAFDAFRDVIDLSRAVPGKPGQSRDIPNWSWPVLNELAALHPGGVTPNLQLELAFALSDEELPERLNHALTLTGNYEKILSASEPDPVARGRQEDLIAYGRARAYRSLGGQGDEQSASQAATLFRKVLASKWIQGERRDLAQYSYASLIDALYFQGRVSEAHAQWEAARKTGLPSDGIDASEMFGQLAAGNSGEAARLAGIAGRGAAEQGEGDNGPPFGAILISIVTQTNDWRGLAKRYLAANRDRASGDYALMIFYAFDGGAKSAEASRLLADRCNAISRNKGTWAGRLKAGDTSAWTEMVVSRLMGLPETASLLDSVDNEERWKQSGLADLPRTRRGLQCEAWFYEAMRAKANGQKERMLDCLRRCAAFGFKAYVEDNMARYILATLK